MTPALARGSVVALLGAESTGKSELARAIADRLSRRGIPATRVDEYLREWCDREGLPLPHEQAAIAAEQTRRIAEAAEHGVVVADTTALMTAVYSDLLFGDTSLYDAALRAHQGYAITLLTALDLPWIADEQRDGPHVREPVDALIRAALGRAGVAYSVVHGSGARRLDSAWNAMNLAAQADEPPASASRPAARWSCDKCSDPVCEHRLFTDLLARRNA